MRVDLTKIEKMLNQEQKRRRERLFSVKDIENILNRLETKRIETMNNPLNKKYLKKIICNAKYTVPCSYKYTAYTTVIAAAISKSGAVKINITTEKAQTRPYGGYIEKFQEIYE